MWVEWVVDARKLRGTDKKAVSPDFKLPWSRSESLDVDSLTFKLLLSPKLAAQQSSRSTFKETRGHAVVQLKCSDSTVIGNDLRVAFRVSWHSQGKSLGPMGPCMHDFAKTAVSGPVPQDDEVDLNEVIDERMLTFSIYVELVPVHRGIPVEWSS